MGALSCNSLQISTGSFPKPLTEEEKNVTNKTSGGVWMLKHPDWSKLLNLVSHIMNNRMRIMPGDFIWGRAGSLEFTCLGRK